MILLLFLATSQLVNQGLGACAPNDVVNDLNSCLTQNSISTYFQFPIVSQNKYTNLCYNTTCLTYCMQTVIKACQSSAHLGYLGNGQALIAAYLGFCDQSETNVTNALTCGYSVNNQAALDIVSTFQTQLQGYVDTRSENTTLICQDWLTMNFNLTTLVTSACSGDAMATLMWQTFMNTVHASCDASLTPSFYNFYRHTPVEQCNSAGMTSLHVRVLVLITVLRLFVTFEKQHNS